MLCMKFVGENGRRQKEHLAAVRKAVPAGLEHEISVSDPFRAVLWVSKYVYMLCCWLLSVFGTAEY